MQALLNNEVTVRLSFFFGVFAVMAIWEVMAPRRPLTQSKAVRWYSNLGIVALNTILARIVFPVTAVVIAMVVTERGWGLLPMLELPG